MRATKTAAWTGPVDINDKLARLEAAQSELGRQDDTATQAIIPLPHKIYKDHVQSVMTSIAAFNLRSEAIDLIHDR